MTYTKTWISILLAGLFLISVFALLQTERTDFIFLFSIYTVSFSLYLILLRSKFFSFKSLLIVGFIAHVIATFSTPLLSNDYFRFIWDGEMAWLGINPFDFRPVDLAHQSFIESNAYLQEVYANLSRLSIRNYTVYPTVDQFYFLISTAFSDNLYANVVTLKVLLLMTEFIGFIYFIKLLKLLKIQLKRIWLLFLNPLWIAEFIGNAHFEGVMVCVLVIALYYLLSRKYLMGSILFALTIQIKIIPLILLPFFFRHFGWKNSIRMFFIIGIITIGLAAIYLNIGNIENFKQSLNLYFKSFEFNSFAIFHIVQLGNIGFGWHTFRMFSSIFSTVTFIALNYMAYKIKPKNKLDFIKTLTYAYLVFLLLSNSAHPWYILPLMFLTVFTEFTFAVIWSYVIFATYFFYLESDNHDFSFRLIVVAEYIVLFSAIWLEIFKKKTTLSFLPKLNKTI